MGPSDAPPYPFDLELNGQPYMLARDPQTGNPAYQEEEPQDNQAWGAVLRRAEKTELYQNWSGGIGTRRDDGTPDARRCIFYSSPNTALTSLGGCALGDFGPLIQGPEVTAVTIPLSAGLTVRRFAQFNSKFYLAIGAKVLESSNGLFTEGILPDVFAATGNGSNVVDLAAFQGTNSVPRLYICQDNGQMFSMDNTGVQWIDGTQSGRNIAPQAVYKTVTAGATFVDYTTTGANFTGLGTLPNNYILLGLDRPFTGCKFTMTLVNNFASVAAGHYWSGSAWVALPSFTDTTQNPAGTTLGQTGTFTWTRPNATWAKTIATQDVNTQTQAYYFVRISFSAALNNATVASFLANYSQELDALVVVNKRLQATRDRNHIIWTEDGGATPTWNESSDPVGNYLGGVVGMAAANNTAFLLRTTDFTSVNEDGSGVSYLPDLFHPPSDSRTDQTIFSWMNALYFSAGNNSFFSFDPITGDATAVGPEVLQTNDGEVQVRITSGCGDRTHCIYAAGYNDAAGKAWLMKRRSYHKAVDPQTGAYQDVPVEAWNMVAYLGARQITAMASWNVTLNGQSQPVLLMGDTNGEVLWCRLPAAVNPLGPSSGVRYSTTTSFTYLPTLAGDDPTLQMTVYGATVNARNLSLGHCAVSVYTKQVTDSFSPAPGAGGSAWVFQGFFFTNGGQRIAFAAPHQGYGVDVCLALATDDNTVTPIVDGFALHLEQEMKQRLVYTFTVLADDRVTDRMGRGVPLQAGDWRSTLNTATTTTPTVSLTRMDGTTATVKVRAVTNSYQSSRDGRSRRSALTVIAAEAD